MLIKKGLIIAAGGGTRLRGGGEEFPKPLRKVAGLPLIKRTILAAKMGGLTEFVVVVGYKKEKIIAELTREDLGVKIEFVENPLWEKSNGLSVLAARDKIRENFILLMSDHVFNPQTLRSLREHSLGLNKAVVAVDSKIQSVFDLTDATKVIVSEGKIRAIGKSLNNYNAVDTGLFLASPDLFDALDEMKKEGDCALTDGIALLSVRGQMGMVNIGEAFWQDVDTEPALAHAERHLLAACVKPTDGIISRNFNRKISLWISRHLVKTGLSANHMTGFTSLTGLFSGILASQGSYAGFLAGALAFKLASILDGVDGEMAKLKMTSSKAGEWLDTISDNLSYLFFISGVAVGLAKRGDPHILLVGTLAVFGLVMAISVMFVYLIRRGNSGSLIAIQEDFRQGAQESLFKKIFASVQFMTKRDFFALLFLILAFLDLAPMILWLSLIATNAMWMVLLSTKFGLFRQSDMGAKQARDPIRQSSAP